MSDGVINGLGVVAAIAGVFRPGEQHQQRIVIRQPFIGRQQAQGIAKLAMADGEVDGQAQVLRIVVQAVGFPLQAERQRVLQQRLVFIRCGVACFLIGQPILHPQAKPAVVIVSSGKRRRKRASAQAGQQQ